MGELLMFDESNGSYFTKMIKIRCDESEKLRQQEIVLKKSQPEPNTGCWLWCGDTVKGGYGRHTLGRRKYLAHRVSYTVFKGEIPNGYTVDHLCKQTCCVNPDHLEAVTMRENNMRGSSFSRINAEKNHCKNGHEYTTDNTYKYKDGRRECKICMECRYKKYYSKNREWIILKNKEYRFKKKSNGSI